VLYHSGIAPARAGGSLTETEADLLAKNLFSITDLSVSVGANSEDFPKDWLFHYRWGGDKGHDSIDGHLINREQIGGRTTAWCPDIQK
jgi:formamidopyrimidine-DNA glycosylase